MSFCTRLAKDGKRFLFSLFLLVTSFCFNLHASRPDGFLSQSSQGTVRYRVIVGKQKAEDASGSLIASFSSNGEAKPEAVETEVRYFTEQEMREWSRRHDVAFIEKDRMLKAVRSPGDERGERQDQHYQSQWGLHGSAAGFRAEEAWDLEIGSDQTVVAVVDTGITSHSDLSSKALSGADFISDPSIANDGSGRDTDASDPGDWIESGDRCYNGSFRPSSWHGTHVAGIVGAKAGNTVGVAGVNWKTKILPVRVLGKCGGLLSDIADGILWAAGIPVNGMPNNPNPADVINLSLGGVGSCGPTLQNAIDRANNKGAVIVAASGNESHNLDQIDYAPANCFGVLTVGALDQNGNFTNYSNYGSSVDVSAPGGTGFSGVLSTYNNGQTSPASESYQSLSGTSMAAPHVSGLAALIKSHKPGLFSAQIREIIRDSSLPISCFIAGACGEGKADAYQALVEAAQTTPDDDFVGNEPVRAPSDGGNKHFKATNDGLGAGCGTIVDNHGGGPGSGGSAGAVAFMLMLVLGFGLTQLRFREV